MTQSEGERDEHRYSRKRDEDEDRGDKCREEGVNAEKIPRDQTVKK